MEVRLKSIASEREALYIQVRQDTDPDKMDNLFLGNPSQINIFNRTFS